jgi:hypothetical protein
MGQIHDFQLDVIAIVSNNTAAARRGNGMFLHGCHDHCIVFHSDRYHGHEIQGISAAAAFAAWWSDDVTAAAATHTHIDTCLRNWDGTPCNPTCTNSGGFGAFSGV